MTRFLTTLTLIWVTGAAIGWAIPPLWRARRGARRAGAVSWYELRPKAGKELTPDKMAANAGAAKKNIEKRNGHAGLIAHRFVDGGQLRSVIGVWGAERPGQVAGQLASAVGGVAEPLPSAPILPDGQRAVAFLKRHDPLDPSLILDPGACSQWLAETMTGTTEPCLSIAVETIEPWESDRKRQWVAVSQMSREGSWGSVGSLGPATARQSGVRMMRVRAVATAPSFDEAATLVTGFGEQLVGFSQTLGARKLDDVGRALPMSIGLWSLSLPWFVVGPAPVAAVLALMGGAMLFAARGGVVNLSRREVDANLDRGLVVGHIPKNMNPRWSLQGFVKSAFRDMNPTDASSKTAGARTANPHPKELFTIDSLQLAQLVGFPSGAHVAVEASSSVERPAPQAVMAASGLRPGTDPSGRAVWWAEADQYSNLVAFGEPGSGKTTVLMNLWWSALVRRGQRRATAGSGPLSPLFWIETKGDGASRAQANARRALATDVGLVNAGAETGPRLDLVLWDDPARGAELLVEAMRYAFGEDDIAERSAGVLRGVFRIAIACPSEIAVALGWPGGRPNVMRLAYWLLGGDPADGRHTEARNRLIEAASGKRVASPGDNGGGLAEALGGPEDEAFATSEIGQAWREFARYMPPHMAKRDSDNLFESSRNKLEALLVARSMWEPAPDRPAFSLADALVGGWAAILNFGPPGPAQRSFTRLLSQRLGAMTLFCLNDAIRVGCVGWQEMGRSVLIFSDEVRDLCGTGNESARDIIGEMADQGRSFGVRMFLATQRPDQLPGAPRRAILGFGCRLYFRLDELANAEAASLDLEEEYSLREIRALGDGTAACRMKVMGNFQAAFTVKPLPDRWLDVAFHDTPVPPSPIHPEAGHPEAEPGPAVASGW